MVIPTCRLADICAGHAGHSPRPNVSASPNVFVNTRGAHRLGDVWPEHPSSGGNSSNFFRGPDFGPHVTVLAVGSPNVFTNTRNQGRVGDAIACNTVVATGSPNVFTN